MRVGLHIAVAFVVALGLIACGDESETTVTDTSDATSDVGGDAGGDAVPGPDAGTDVALDDETVGDGLSVEDALDDAAAEDAVELPDATEPADGADPDVPSTDVAGDAASGCELDCGLQGRCEGGRYVCDDGWTGAACDAPVCTGGCGDGVCSAPGVCICNEGWQGASCDTPVCAGGCGNGTCGAPGRCSCDDGWAGGACDAPVCASGCGNGVCSAPGVCSCDEGWQGTTCDTPVCAGGCGNGTCGAPGMCSCDDGWAGAGCDDPVCAGGCGNGACTASSTCSCEEVWEGAACNVPVCAGGCGNGACTAPSTCSCEEGWQGDACDQPRCDPACVHGACTGPATCECVEGWEGSACAVATAYTLTWNVNGGASTHGNPTTYTIETPTFVFAATTREGHRFLGWFEGEERVSAISAGATGDRVFEARWEPAYALTWVLGGGTGNTNPADYTEADLPLVFTAPRQGGHRFEGWYADAEFTTPVTGLDVGATGDRTFYARWTAYSFAVGDTGPAGGIIVRVNGSSQWRLTWRYLEVSPESATFTAQWGPTNANVEGTVAAAGSGRANTERIAAAYPDGEYAANVVLGLTIGGFSDWAVPARSDLDSMYAERDRIGYWSESFYWSSTDDTTSLSRAWAKGMTSGSTVTQAKNGSLVVRPVRAF